MSGGPVVPPESISLPERIDRKGKLGPFPSGGAALKFLLVSAEGALIALRFGPLLWPPFLVVGLLFSVHRPEHPSLDEQMLGYARFRWRTMAGAPRPASPLPPPRDGRPPGAPCAAGLEAGGVPIAFLPPEDARRLFDLYRQLLRNLSGPVIVQLQRVPWRVEQFAPGRFTGGEEEGRARSGYAELVRLLARRRFHRRVQLLLLDPGRGRSSARAELDEQLALAASALDVMDVPHRVIRGRELARALDRSGAPEGP